MVVVLSVLRDDLRKIAEVLPDRLCLGSTITPPSSAPLTWTFTFRVTFSGLPPLHSTHSGCGTQSKLLPTIYSALLTTTTFGTSRDSVQQDGSQGSSQL